MSQDQSKQKITSQELDKLIADALKKVKGRKENDLCRYLPVSTGGYMHHFTFRKMKGESPDQLATMIRKYVTSPSNPVTVAPKPRAPRGSRKRRDQLSFTRGDVERLLNLARLAGDKEMIRKLTPKKDLRQIKRELISSIRHGHVEQELWNAYVEAVSAQNSQGADHQSANELLNALSNTMNLNYGANATASANLTPTGLPE